MGENKYSDLAFDEKYDKYSLMIYRIAYQYTFSKSLSEDIMQEVFIKLFVNKKKFNDDQHEKAWLIRVTINHCKNAIKAKNNNNLKLYENDCLKEENEFEITINDKIDISNALKKLPQNERTIILLYYYEGLSIVQISKCLRMKENTVKSHLKRAKEKLKNILER